MSKLPALRKPLPLAAFVAGAILVLCSTLGAEAQQRPEGNAAGPGGDLNGYYVQRGPRGVGGYSLTLSDIWGPAKMPPAPRDFGPHFDFPPEPLNGAPLHDPYPN
ncbi:MAG: hypothetical protein WED13_02320 [Methyloceanibacter sp.]